MIGHAKIKRPRPRMYLDRKITASDATVIVICHTDIVTSTRSGASF